MSISPGGEPSGAVPCRAEGVGVSLKVSGGGGTVRVRPSPVLHTPAVSVRAPRRLHGAPSACLQGFTGAAAHTQGSLGGVSRGEGGGGGPMGDILCMWRHLHMWTGS